MIGNDCTGSCKSNFHMIMTTTMTSRPLKQIDDRYQVMPKVHMTPQFIIKWNKPYQSSPVSWLTVASLHCAAWYTTLKSLDWSILLGLSLVIVFWNYTLSFWVSDCCLIPNEQYFSHIMERTSYIQCNWLWRPFCYCSQNFKLFCFPIFQFWVYLMKFIPETQ